MRFEITTPALPVPLVATTASKAMVLAAAFVSQGHSVTVTPIKKDK